jgi:hypothetical protein
MVTLLLFLLATIGLSNIIVHGKILDVIGLRPWLKAHMSENWFQLFECYECTGFWSGMFMGLLLVSWNPLIFIPCGFAGSVVSQFYSELVYLIRAKTDFVVEEEDEQQQS